MERRRSVPLELLLFLAAAGAGCITINLYFPVAELEDAAEEIVKDVRSGGLEGNGAPRGNEGASGEGSSGEPAAGAPGSPVEPGAPVKEEALRAPAPSRPPARGLLAIFEPRAAHASAPDEKDGQGKGDKAGIKIDISTPVIKSIRETLKKRYPKLVPFFEKGALGEGRDGYVALRVTDGLSLKEKRDIQALLKEENEDRKNLYTEIARENGIEASRVPDIGVLFSAKWQETSKTGWWIEKEKGKWIRKPEEKKKRNA